MNRGVQILISTVFLVSHLESASSNSSPRNSTIGLTVDTTGEYFSSPNFPGYPNSYSKNLDYNWQILSADAGHRVVLELIETSIVNSTDCDKAAVSVYDGPSPSSPLLMRSCGPTTTSLVISTGDVLYVKFRADDGFADQGILARAFQLPAPYSVTILTTTSNITSDNTTTTITATTTTTTTLTSITTTITKTITVAPSLTSINITTMNTTTSTTTIIATPTYTITTITTTSTANATSTPLTTTFSTTTTNDSPTNDTATYSTTTSTTSSTITISSPPTTTTSPITTTTSHDATTYDNTSSIAADAASDANATPSDTSPTTTDATYTSADATYTTVVIPADTLPTSADDTSTNTDSPADAPDDDATSIDTTITRTDATGVDSAADTTTTRTDATGVDSASTIKSVTSTEAVDMRNMVEDGSHTHTEDITTTRTDATTGVDSAADTDTTAAVETDIAATTTTADATQTADVATAEADPVDVDADTSPIPEGTKTTDTVYTTPIDSFITTTIDAKDTTTPWTTATASSPSTNITEDFDRVPCCDTVGIAGAATEISYTMIISVATSCGIVALTSGWLVYRFHKTIFSKLASTFGGASTENRVAPLDDSEEIELKSNCVDGDS